MTVVMVISFLVSVPVLSVQITSTEPKVSAAGKVLTITCCFFAILETPIARITDVVAGRPSGIEPTTMVTMARAKTGRLYLPMIRPKINSKTAAAMMAYEIPLPIPSISRIIGERPLRTSETAWEILPNSVSWPVATTMPIPLPPATAVEANAILL